MEDVDSSAALDAAGRSWRDDAVPGVAAGASSDRQASHGRGEDRGVRGRQRRGRHLGAAAAAESLVRCAVQRISGWALLRRPNGGGAVAVCATGSTADDRRVGGDGTPADSSAAGAAATLVMPRHTFL